MQPREYEMNIDQYEKLIDACKPVPMIALNCGYVGSVQERANQAWKRLGDEMGFDWTTVTPNGRGVRSFSAVPKPESPPAPPPRKLNPQVHALLEGIDSYVFSGDGLVDHPDYRKAFRGYMERWERACKTADNEPFEDTQDKGEEPF